MHLQTDVFTARCIYRHFIKSVLLALSLVCSFLRDVPNSSKSKWLVAKELPPSRDSVKVKSDRPDAGTSRISTPRIELEEILPRFAYGRGQAGSIRAHCLNVGAES